MGGSDDPSNLIELTPEEHANAHKLLYEQHGNWQDYVAWKGLAGLIGKDEIMKKIYEELSGEGNGMYGKPCYYKMTEEEKQQWKDNISKGSKGILKPWSEERKQKYCGEGNPQYGKEPWNKGKIGLQSHTEESKRKISKPVVFRGVEYYSADEAARQNNTTAYYIMKEINGVNTPTRNRSIQSSVH